MKKEIGESGKGGQGAEVCFCPKAERLTVERDEGCSGCCEFLFCCPAEMMVARRHTREARGAKMRQLERRALGMALGTRREAGKREMR